MDDFERDWRACLDLLEACRKDYRAALDKSAKEKRKAARAYWGVVALVCRCYNRPANWPELGDVRDVAPPRFAFPPRLASVIANQAHYLHVGQVPPMLGNVVGKGRTAPGPHELRHIAIAVAFVAAVRAGHISGIKAPIKYVANKFGVTPRTLQKWIEERPWVAPDDFGNNLPAELEEAATTYRVAGRSTRAIRDRQSKRRS